MPNQPPLANIRRDYGQLTLNDDEILDCPLSQFQFWMADIIQTDCHDPTAMVLSTVDEEGHPDARVVLLKGLGVDLYPLVPLNAFLFYTNYQSTKAHQLDKTPYASLTFYWPQLARQVRVRGTVQRVPKQVSADYFKSRPLSSQCSAIVSPQSQPITQRERLEEKIDALMKTHPVDELECPDYWGGYQVLATHIEFWQGRDNRLHDRITYHFHQEQWHHQRLAP